MEATGLQRYDDMCRAISACVAVDEAKDIRDRAQALEKYFAQAGNLEAERQACNVRLRAERRCGVLLREMKDKGERASGGERTDLVASCDEVPPTLTDLGITRSQSSRFQELANVPDAEFEAALAEPEKPSTARVIRKHKAASNGAEKMDADALWLWGRLRDFERRMGASEPGALVEKMTPAMRQDVRRVAPSVIAYLKAI